MSNRMARRATATALAQAATLAFASSPAIAAHLTQVGFLRVETLTNVADVELFASHALPAQEREERVLFAGNLIRKKVDFLLLAELLRSLPANACLVLAGPCTGDRTDRAAVSGLVHAGAIWLGALAPSDLADLAGRCRVGIVPYLVNDHTLGVNPLKIYEYLAAGLQVVTTELPALESVTAPGIHTASIEGFVGVVVGLMGADREGPGSHPAELAAHSWPVRLEWLRARVLQEIREA